MKGYIKKEGNIKIYDFKRIAHEGYEETRKHKTTIANESAGSNENKLLIKHVFFRLFRALRRPVFFATVDPIYKQESHGIIGGAKVRIVI